MQLKLFIRDNKKQKRLNKYRKLPVNQRINYKSLYNGLGFENAMLNLF